MAEVVVAMVEMEVQVEHLEDPKTITTMTARQNLLQMATFHLLPTRSGDRWRLLRAWPDIFSNCSQPYITFVYSANGADSAI